MQRQKRSSHETIVQSWGRFLVPPQRIHITVSLNCFADTETPPPTPHTEWKKLLYAARKLADPRLIGTRRLMMLTPSDLTTNQSEECPHLALWTITIKLLINPLQVKRNKEKIYKISNYKCWHFPLHLTVFFGSIFFYVLYLRDN